MNKMETRLFCISAVSKKQLIKKIDAIIFNSEKNFFVDKKDKVVISIVVNSNEEMKSKLLLASNLLKSDTKSIVNNEGIYYTDNPIGDGKLAFLYPGQGSQHRQMLQYLQAVLPEFKTNLEINEQFIVEKTGHSFLSGVYGQVCVDEELLTKTDYIQLTLACFTASLTKSLKKMGMNASFFAGHSFGEIPALFASGVISESFLYEMSHKRGCLFQKAIDEKPGKMLAVFADNITVNAFLNQFKGNLEIANINSSNQTVLSGSFQAITSFKEIYKNKVKMVDLKTSGAFHSAHMTVVEPLWMEFLVEHADDFSFSCNKAIYSNVSGEQYQSHEELIGNLSKQISKTVEWKAICENLYNDGARIFIEVGPGNVLTKLNRKIYEDKHVVSLAIDGKSEAAFYHVMARLISEGVSLKWENDFTEKYYGEEKESSFHPLSEIAENIHSKAAILNNFFDEQSTMLQIMEQKNRLPAIQYSILKNMELTKLLLENSSYFLKDQQSTQEEIQKTVIFDELSSSQSAKSSELTEAIEQIKQFLYVSGALVGEEINEQRMPVFLIEKKYDELLSKYQRYPLLKQEMLNAENLQKLEKLISLIFDAQIQRKTEMIHSNWRYLPVYKKVFTTQNQLIANSIVLIGEKGPLYDFYKKHIELHGIELVEIQIREKDWYLLKEDRMLSNFQLEEYLISIGNQFGEDISYLIISSDYEGVNQTISLDGLNRSILSFSMHLYNLEKIFKKYITELKKPGRILFIEERKAELEGSLGRGILRTLRHDLKSNMKIYTIRLDGEIETLHQKYDCIALLFSNLPDELLLTKDGKFSQSLIKRPLSFRDSSPSDLVTQESRIIVFGGGSGISSQIAQALAEQFHCQLVIVGRTPFPSKENQFIVNSEKEIRKKIFDNLAKKMNGTEFVGQKLLRKEIEQYNKNQLLLSTRKAIESAGGRFTYYNCDISNQESLGKLLKTIEAQEGAISGIIHGAGTIIRGGEKKDFEAASLMEAKTSSVFTLYDYFKDYPLKFSILFSSISALYGLPGMSEYAAANEFVNSFSEFWNKNVNYPVLSIMWSLWSETGIMKDSNQSLKKLGLTGISNEMGKQMFLDELLNLTKDTERILLTDETFLNYSKP